MDNALIVDGILAVVLIAGTLIGANRGLFKSLMGILVVVGALVGATLLADLLADPITDVIAPKIEDAAVRSFSDALDKTVGTDAAEGQQTILELFEKYGVSGDVMGKILDPLKHGAQSAASQAKEKAADAFRGAISASVRALVRGTAHAALLLVLYVVLLFVLRLLAKVLNLVFDLPVLSTVNGVGGAILGFLEAALLLYVAAYAASHFGVKAITDHAEDTCLLPIFLNHSPVELISSFARKG